MKGGSAPPAPVREALTTLPKKRLIITVVGTLLGLLLAALDQTVVGTALPRIVGDLGGFDRFAWVFTAYMLPATTVLPIAGRLSDIYGRKPSYLVGIAVFMAGSILAGLSQSMMQLIVFRGVQGLGAAVIMANAFAIVGDLFPPAERGKWQGVFGGVFAVASVVGPMTGGYITDNLSWRWVFYVNLPVGLAAALVFLLAMPRSAGVSVKRKIDLAGVFTLMVAVVSLLLALTWASNVYPWLSPQILGLLAFSLGMFSLFIVVEKRGSDPLLPPFLFSNRIFNVGVGVTFLTGIGMFGSILFLPLFIQTVMGASATDSGLMLTPMMLSMAVGSMIFGQVISRTGRYRFVGVTGMALITAGLFAFSLMDSDTTYRALARDSVLVGLGLGATFPTYMIAVQNAFPHGFLGVATSSVQFFRSVGGTVGAAVMGSLLAVRMGAHLTQALAEARSNGALAPQVSAAFGSTLDVTRGMDALNGLRGNGVSGLPPALLGPVKTAFTQALHDVFLLAVAITVVGLALAFFMREVPLRRSNSGRG
ncbi:MAG: MFS transporter [Chloroflexi bacterium]|nr:MFS transporter [Chloroflexota bacterium]